MIKKLLITILFSLFSFGLYSQVVTIGYFEGFPSNFLNKETGEATGSTVDYLRDFTIEMGYKPVFVGPLPFPRLFEMLKSGEIDTLLGLSYVKEREQFILYPLQPYRVLNPYVFVKKDSPIVKINNILDMLDYSYIYRQGGVLPSFLRPYKDALKINYLSKEDWLDRGLEMLMLGRVEGIITTSVLSVEYGARKKGVDIDLRKVLIPGDNDPLYLGISKKSKIAEEFLEKYNNNIINTKLNISDYDNREY